MFVFVIYGPLTEAALKDADISLGTLPNELFWSPNHWGSRQKQCGRWLECGTQSFLSAQHCGTSTSRSKWSILVWRSNLDKFPTDDKVQELGFSMASRCHCCSAPSFETVPHLLLPGEATVVVWRIFHPANGSSNFASFRLSLSSDPEITPPWVMVLAAIVWLGSMEESK